jgi:phosphatidylglycerophosphatase A
MKLDKIINKEIQNLNFNEPYVLLATWFGWGLLAKAPGTWGSLAAIPFALVACLYLSFEIYVALLILLFPVAFWATARFEKQSNIHDSKMIVIDEVLGQWIALIPAFYMGQFNLLWISVAFILFRAFDIIKPWPVSWADQKLKGALGVIIDDVIAGVMAAIVCFVGVYYYA